jgi:hypothetical protein
MHSYVSVDAQVRTNHPIRNRRERVDGVLGDGWIVRGALSEERQALNDNGTEGLANGP